MLTLLASKNPTNEIVAKIALDGGYDPCKTINQNDSFWRTQEGCGADFVADNFNGYCYKVMSTIENLDDGEKICKYDFDADLVMFDTNSELTGLIELVITGMIFCLFC